MRRGLILKVQYPSDRCCRKREKTEAGHRECRQVTDGFSNGRIRVSRLEHLGASSTGREEAQHFHVKWQKILNASQKHTEG